MPTITPDPINAATPPDSELVSNIPTELRALKARVNALAGIPANVTNYFRKNLIDNGSFQIFQRLNNLLHNVSFAYSSATPYFFLDRWCMKFGAGFTGTLTLQATLRTQNVFKRSRQVTLSTAVGPIATSMYQRIPEARKYQGKTMTLQLGCNIPSAVLAAGTFNVLVQYFYGTGGSPTATATLVNANIASSGDNSYSVTFTCPAPVSQAEFGTNFDDYIVVQFSFQLVNGQPVIWDYVQLEEGAAASPLEVLTYQEELERCQRHFSTSYSSGVRVGQADSSQCVSFFAPTTSTTPAVNIAFPEPMLAVPTMKLYSTNTVNAQDKVYKETATAGDVAGTNTAGRIGNRGFGIINLGAAAIVDHFYSFHWTADAESY